MLGGGGPISLLRAAAGCDYLGRMPLFVIVSRAVPNCWTASMKLLGLTGNIASGKSTVAGILAGFGAEVIHTDQLVHELYRSGTPTYTAVSALFGKEVIGVGGIDRVALGKIVFSDPLAMAELESLVHPAVAIEVGRLVAVPSTAPAAVIEAIKLVESELVSLIDELWVITAPDNVRLTRLVQSRGLEPSAARARMGLESSNQEKARLFQSLGVDRPVVLIHNGNAIHSTRDVVTRAWQTFCPE